jgi:hypothetical protein
MTTPNITPKPFVYPKMFVLSGPFGSGKTVTALSYVRPGVPPKRLLIDMKIGRSDVYKSPDSSDHPDKLMWAFEYLAVPVPTATDIQLLMIAVHKGECPFNSIIIENVLLLQNLMQQYWSIKANLVSTASIYGLAQSRQLTAKDFKPYDAGTLSLMKTIFSLFIQDLRKSGIDILVTTPLHNIWTGYGQSGYGPDGLPKMRVLGKSAMMWDAWQQWADTLWILERTKEVKGLKQLKNLPTVSMDVFVPKNSFPGLPSVFEWPGWETVWDWHENRTHVPDMSLIKGDKPGEDPETVKGIIDDLKRKIVRDLPQFSVEEVIKPAMQDSLAPEMKTDNYEEVKAWILRWAKEHDKLPSSPLTEK